MPFLSVRQIVPACGLNKKSDIKQSFSDFINGSLNLLQYSFIPSIASFSELISGFLFKLSESVDFFCFIVGIYGADTFGGSIFSENKFLMSLLFWFWFPTDFPKSYDCFESDWNGLFWSKTGNSRPIDDDKFANFLDKSSLKLFWVLLINWFIALCEFWSSNTWLLLCGFFNSITWLFVMLFEGLGNLISGRFGNCFILLNSWLFTWFNCTPPIDGTIFCWSKRIISGFLFPNLGESNLGESALNCKLSSFNLLNSIGLSIITLAFDEVI